ncbi:MAG: molybdopterin-guanine dinucleotide biosynthesis protein MobA [Leptothrix sp. (in: Bacteria)]|nr:molybdopterin-guanine dinucleotide biosynthesis protein MobA [Leptothrix sp. (in: b-proteobacteria)]
MRFRPTIVVPAAGPGHRFGGPLHKLAQPFDGSTVLGRTLRHAIASQLPVVVVTTAARLPLAGALLATRDIVVLDEAEAARGMGASIAAGIAERSGAPGWVVLPGDMPLVQPATLLAVAGALEQQAVVYAQHRGRAGHPVAFAAELYSELMQLNGDDGVRRLMLRYPAFGQEVDDAGVLLGVDTPADLETMRKVLEQAI